MTKQNCENIGRASSDGPGEEKAKINRGESPIVFYLTIAICYTHTRTQKNMHISVKRERMFLLVLRVKRLAKYFFKSCRFRTC